MNASDKDLLLSLPSELTCRVLSEWLDLKDVVKIDSAYCHSTKRANLHTALALPNFSAATKYSADLSPWVIDWAISRHARLQSLAVSSMTPELLEFTEKYGAQIKNLMLTGLYFPVDDSDGFYTLIRHCYNTTVLEIKDFAVCNVSVQLLFRALDNLAHLRELTIHHHVEDDNGEDNVAILVNPLRLRTLSLRCTSPMLSMPVLQALSPACLKNLHFDVPNHAVYQELVKIFPHCAGLSSVTLGGYLLDDTLIALLESCPAIEQLDLRGSCQITDESAGAIASALPRLTSLDVSGLEFTDVLLHEIAAHRYATLRTLKLYKCYDMTDDGLNRVLHHCTNLTTLHFSFASRLGDAVAYHLMTNLVTLVMECGFDAFSSLKMVALHCRKLEHVEIYLRELTDLILPLFTELNFPRLRTLKVTNTSVALSDMEKEGIVVRLDGQLPSTTIVVMSPGQNIMYFV